MSLENSLKLRIQKKMKKMKKMNFKMTAQTDCPTQCVGPTKQNKADFPEFCGVIFWYRFRDFIFLSSANIFDV